MLEVRDLTFSVTEDGADKEIVHGVSFTIPDDRLVVLTGPNGSGKSTLSRLIAGIETPISGQILFDGVDITAKSITERARMGISYAFQQPVRFKGIQVLDLLRFASGKASLSVTEACDYLAMVGLCAKDYVGREVNSSLSGGELKRIEIATVLARKAKLSIFDEPEAGIDLWSFQDLIRAFDGMRRSVPGCSYLIISHQERILETADQIMVLSGGRLEAMGDRDQILPGLIGTANAVPACRKIEGGDEAVC